jgi:uncharacterized phage infection (PIP) family protein YhgE
MKRALFVLAVLALAGCSKKAPECEAMIKVINPAAEKVKAASGKGERPEDHVKAMNDIASASDGAASGLAKVELTVPELQKISTEYQAMAKGIASAARELGDAVKSADAAGKQMEKTAKDFEAAIGKHAQACEEAKDPVDQEGCKRFADGVGKLPADPTKTAEVEKVAAELDQVAWKGDAIKAAAKGVVTAMRANNKVMGDLAAAQSKAEKAEKSFGTSAENEGKIVERLNKVCHD